MLKIAIDCRFGSVLGGLGSYTRGLVTALLHADESHAYTLLVRSEHEPWLHALPKKNLRLMTADFTHYSVAEQIRLPSLIRVSGCDLYFSPHFNVPFHCPVPFVCTVHDLILHRFPNDASFFKRLAYRTVLASAVRRAKAVVCVSDATRLDLLHRYPITSEKSRTIHPGISTVCPSASPSRSKPFLLYVGNAKQHKNVQMLIDAFHAAELPGIELVLACNGPETEKLRLGSNVRVVDSLSEAEIDLLYSEALGFVTATLAEGFCLPVLEAMAYGCPVLATNIGPIPEISGGHALLVRPELSNLTEGIRRLATDPSLRSAPGLDAAKRHAESFTWEKSAEKHLELFTRLL